jgi:hypothetical protein
MSNEAAIGYMILAALKAEVPESKVREIENYMKDCMDIYTEAKAESVYKKFFGPWQCPPVKDLLQNGFPIKTQPVTGIDPQLLYGGMPKDPEFYPTPKYIVDLIEENLKRGVR